MNYVSRNGHDDIRRPPGSNHCMYELMQKVRDDGGEFSEYSFMSFNELQTLLCV
jgi:hypothetical protein